MLPILRWGGFFVEGVPFCADDGGGFAAASFVHDGAELTELAAAAFGAHCKQVIEAGVGGEDEVFFDEHRVCDGLQLCVCVDALLDKLRNGGRLRDSLSVAPPLRVHVVRDH